MKAQDRLREAVQMVQAGRHAEALSEYEWFHNHSLDEEPALCGVRLSFALDYWFDLGETYPPALARLVAIRDEKTRRVLEECSDWHLFNDVAAINETLGEEAATYGLFLSVREKSPEFAGDCLRVAFPAILKSRDYGLARSYLADPEDSLRQKALLLNENLEWAGNTSDDRARAAQRDAFTHLYAEDIFRLLDVLRNTNDAKQATSLYGRACELVNDTAARKQVQELLGQMYNGNTAL